MKAVVFTLGCKVNEVESAGIMSALERNGWEVSDELGFADIYVLNTCAVTREAEKKSRQLVARARKFNPQARVFVCGCASEKDKKAFEERGVDFVSGARNKGEVIAAICAEYGGDCTANPFPKQTKTRAFVKIQDGCNNFCSYCIIPYLRGREKSRSIGDIVGEIAKISSPEVVLNGINISAYRDGDKDLADLIFALKGVEKRIRLGSLECTIIDERLLTTLKELKDFAPQFHLSLQSGSSAVLKAMNRHYTREEYLEKCALIYSYFPEAAITTDIIAGFPTETEHDFDESLSIIKEAGFARVHAFPFSAREGTAACKLKDIPAPIKRERLNKLISAATIAEQRYIEKFLGKTAEVVAEEYSDGFTTGYTGNYIKAYVPAEIPAGARCAVVLKQSYRDGALAELSEIL